MNTASEWITVDGVSYVRIPVDTQWLAFARIVADDGLPAISELRIVPVDVAAGWPQGHPPEWRDVHATTPSRGLMRRHLKELDLFGHLSDENAFRKWLGLNPSS
jgi:hypothetical protein